MFASRTHSKVYEPSRRAPLGLSRVFNDVPLAIHTWRLHGSPENRSAPAFNRRMYWMHTIKPNLSTMLGYQNIKLWKDLIGQNSAHINNRGIDTWMNIILCRSDSIWYFCCNVWLVLRCIPWKAKLSKTMRSLLPEISPLRIEHCCHIHGFLVQVPVVLGCWHTFGTWVTSGWYSYPS